MKKENQIYEIAILGRVLWNLHSLNNEGTVGNVTEPRSVRIVDPNTKEPITTDGISGEMLKHIHSQFLWELVDKKYLCEGCQKMEPERGFKDETIRKKKSFKEASEEAIKKCVICDLHGFLFPGGENTASRDSLIQFGWAVGKGEVLRDIHTHARQAIGEKRKQKGEEDSSQMIYHRPTRSGIYALVSVFQPWRIGLNNANMKYIQGVDRKGRYQLALKAYQAMFLRTEGAMTTTRLPHTEKFEGVIVISKTNFPVPVISPLKDSYIEEIKKINEKMDKIFELNEFGSLEDFVGEINSLLEAEPYQIQI
ncbi:DevR family CRISPR-associated autoregulator [Candidatus Parcubacteria bacterium]|nr:DevR family CRISPR-associated autoregulator [Candidatus Parcubacteria bacterium]